MSLAIEEKYEQVRNLITLGKERGYLLYDDVNNMLPPEIHSAEDMEDLLSTFERYGINIYEDLFSAKAALAASGEVEVTETEPKEEIAPSDDAELDLTPGTLSKTEDPVRLYLREMGSAPLLKRQGEVALAKRIERGQLIVLKTISRSPIVLKNLLATGEELRKGTRSIKDIVQFDQEELTDEIVEERARQTLRIIGKIEKHFEIGQKQAARLLRTPRLKARGMMRAKRQLARTRIEMSLLVRSIGFNPRERKRLIDIVRQTVERLNTLERAAPRSARSKKPAKSASPASSARSI